MPCFSDRRRDGWQFCRGDGDQINQELFSHPADYFFGKFPKFEMLFGKYWFGVLSFSYTKLAGFKILPKATYQTTFWANIIVSREINLKSDGVSCIVALINNFSKQIVVS